MQHAPVQLYTVCSVNGTEKKNLVVLVVTGILQCSEFTFRVVSRPFPYLQAPPAMYLLNVAIHIEYLKNVPTFLAGSFKQIYIGLQVILDY